MSYKPEIRGYVLFDHGGVLDGTPADPSNPIKYNKKTDLVTVSNAEGMSFLPNGIAIFNMLYELDLNGYKILYASANKEHDQLKIKNGIENDAKQKNVKFPPIYAMPVLDKDQFQTATIEVPEVINDREHGIIVVGIGSDNDLSGKAFLRRALENAGVINAEFIRNSIVFDDGHTVVRHAQREGYQAYRVGDALAENELGDGPAIPGGDLHSGVKAFYEMVRSHLKIWVLDPVAETEKSVVEEESKVEVTKFSSLKEIFLNPHDKSESVIQYLASLDYEDALTEIDSIPRVRWEMFFGVEIDSSKLEKKLQDPLNEMIDYGIQLLKERLIHEDLSDKRVEIDTKLQAMQKYLYAIFNRSVHRQAWEITSAYNTFEQKDVNRGTGFFRIQSFFENKRYRDQKGYSRLVKSTLGSLGYDLMKVALKSNVTPENTEPRRWDDPWDAQEESAEGSLNKSSNSGV